MIPLVHDLSEKTVVIFGGGELGTHKARLFEGKADVYIIGDNFTSELEDLNVNLIEKSLDSENGIMNLLNSIGEVFLAITATGKPGLDELISTACHRYGAIVNKVDGPIEDVITPSIIDMDPLLVAISTKGNSPTTSKFIRKKLNPFLSRAREMVKLQSELREQLKGNPSKDDLLWRVIDNTRIWKKLSNDYQEAKELALRVIEDDD